MHIGLDVYYTIILLEKTYGNFLDVTSVCLLASFVIGFVSHVIILYCIVLDDKYTYTVYIIIIIIIIIFTSPRPHVAAKWGAR